MLGSTNLRHPSDADRAHVRRNAVAWAAAMAMDRSTIYLDTETTGLDGTAEIIEVAAVDYRGHTLLDTLVQPQGHIPSDAQAVHGISQTMVAHAPEWRDVYAELITILARGTIVVYNAEFDFKMVNQMNRRHAMPVWNEPWHCAMRHYSGFAGVWHERFGNYRWHKLDSALAQFGHPPGGHRALADATACRLIVQGIARG